MFRSTLFSRRGPGVGPHIALSPQVDVQLQVAVPQPGPYALVVEYANEDARQEVDVAVHTPQRAPQQGVLTLHPCSYRCVGSGWKVQAWGMGGAGAGFGTPAALPTNHPCPPPAPCAEAPPWTPSTTWPSSTWTRRPASDSQPSRHGSSW